MAEVQAYQQKIAEEMQKLKELETEENKRYILYDIWVTVCTYDYIKVVSTG